MRQLLGTHAAVVVGATCVGAAAPGPAEAGGTSPTAGLNANAKDLKEGKTCSTDNP